MSLISIIIPFKQRPGDPDCIRRLAHALQCFAGVPDTEVVVYDTGASSLAALDLKLLSQGNLTYYHQPEPGVFAPGRVRNHAIEKARGRFIFLFDADLLISHSAIETLFSQLQAMEQEGAQVFRMFPCLYLSKGYSQHFAEQFD